MSSNRRFGWMLFGAGGVAVLTLIAVLVPGGFIARTVQACSPVVTYNATVEAPVAGGSISPAAGTYAYAVGTTVYFQANPDPGWAFTGWSGSASGTTNPMPMVVTNHFTIRATFKPVVQFTATASSYVESAETALVYLTCGGISEYTVTFFYSVSGTATAGTDYTALSGWGTIPASSGLGTIMVPLHHDTIVEPDETIVLTLTSVGGRDSVLGTNTRHTLTILDNDYPAASVTALSSAPEAGQAAGIGQFLVTLAQPCPNRPCFVAFDPAGGTAINGTDFQIDSSPLWFNPGESQKLISYWSIRDDGVVSVPNKVFPLRLVQTYDSRSAPVSATNGAATGTIVDNDASLTIIARDRRTNQPPTYVYGDARPESGVYPLGSQLELRADTTGIDARFIEYTGDIATTENPHQFILDTSKTVYAYFLETRGFSFGVEPGGFDPSNNILGCGYVGQYTGTGIPERSLNWGVYEKGTTATVMAVAYPGWRFGYWTNGNGSGPLPFANGSSSTSNPASFIMNDHVCAVAHFVTVCGLTLNQATGGTASVSPVVPAVNGTPYYDVGTQVTLTASPAQGYLFQEWLIQAADGAVTHLHTNPAQFTIAGNVTVTPVFTPKFTLTTAVLENGTTSATGGTVSPTPGPHEYPAQAMVHLKAEPSIGWCFVRWDGITGPNGQTITNPETDLTMNSDKSATAVFTRAAKLTIIASGQGRFSCSANGQSIPYSSISYLPPATQVSVTATPAADWAFSAWSGYIDSNERTVQLTMDSDQVLIARFEHKPGAASLDLVADLAEFLVAVGALPTAGDINQLTFDTGDLESDHVTPKPNGIPDVAELRLLECVLRSATYDQTSWGGAGYDHVWKAWRANLAQVQVDLPLASSGVQRTVAAYMTLGSEGHRTFAAKATREHLGATLNPSAYTTEAADFFDAEGDVDGDGVWNRLEWKIVLAHASAPVSLDSVGAYLAAATARSVPPQAEVDLGLDLGGNAGAGHGTNGGDGGGEGTTSTTHYMDPSSIRSVQLLPGTQTGSLHPISYEVRVLDPPGQESNAYRVSSLQTGPTVIDAPTGSELLVSVAEAPEADWFDGWSAPGTLIDGSARRVERFRVPAGNDPVRIQPLSWPVAEADLPAETPRPYTLPHRMAFVGPRANLIEYVGTRARVPWGCRMRLSTSAAKPGNYVLWGCHATYDCPFLFNAWSYQAIGSTVEMCLPGHPERTGMVFFFDSSCIESPLYGPVFTNSMSSTTGGRLCPGRVVWDETMSPGAICTGEYGAHSVWSYQEGLESGQPYQQPLYWGVPERGYELSTVSGMDIHEDMHSWVPTMGYDGYGTVTTSSVSPRGIFEPEWRLKAEQAVTGCEATPAEAGALVIYPAKAYYTRKTTTPVLLTAVPKAGFAFDHWTLDGPAYQVLADGTLGAVISPETDPSDEQSGRVTQEKVGIKMADASAQGDRAVVANFATLTMTVAACEGVQVKVQFLYDPASGGLFEAKTETVSDGSKPYEGIPGVRVMACPAEGYALSNWVIKYYNKDTNLLDHQTTATDNSVAVESKGFNIRIEAQGRVLAAKFVEDPSQHYGFDGFSSNQCAYKSVAENCSDTAKVKLYVPPTNVKVAIPETDALKLAVSPVQVSAQEQVETVTSLAAVIGASASAEVLVKSGVSPTEATVASLTTKVYKPVQRAILHLVRVSRPGGSPPATIDAAALMSYLNNTIFNQAVVSFSVNTRPDLTVNYDISGRDEDQGNGLDRPEQDGGVETTSIIAAQLAEVPGVDNAEYYVFVVAGIRGLDDGALGEVSGFRMRTTADQHPWMFVTGARCPFVIAHELGHCLGLGDLDRPHQPSMDPTNLMAYSSLDDNRKLRASQWDTVRPSQP